MHETWGLKRIAPLPRPRGGPSQGKALWGFFLQFGRADENLWEITTHVGLGVAWIGPFTGRDEDVAGFGATWVQLRASRVPASRKDRS